MNVFRLAGDMTHLLSIVVLLLKIRTMKSCAGISLKTQELYVIVFLTRYLDLFTKYYSFYNTVMKLVFLGTSIAIVWYMRYHKPVKLTYDKDQDTFQHYFLILSCLALALLVHRAFFVIEVLWTFSVYLEAVAILPQLVLLQRSRNIDNLTGNYVFLLGIFSGGLCRRKNSGHLSLVLFLAFVGDALLFFQFTYRAFYIINWVYRFFMENPQVHWIPWVSGVVQTALYADFFYYYVKSWKNKEKLKLPS